MVKLLCIAAGGALGAVLRYGASVAALSVLGRGFPWGTLAVNLLGSFLIGLLWALFQTVRVGEYVQELLVIGLLGAFTTFSTFSIENVHLLRTRPWPVAAGNVVLSLAGGLLLVWAGMGVGRAVGQALR